MVAQQEDSCWANTFTYWYSYINFEAHPVPIYTSWLGQEKIFCWPAFVTRLLTPQSRNSGYGLLLGCRSGLDRGPFEKTFFWQSESSNPKTGEIFTLYFGPRSQSIGRGRISREGALDHRKSRERRDKIFAAKTENAKTPPKKIGAGKQFSVENYHFLGRGKTIFFGGGV